MAFTRVTALVAVLVLAVVTHTVYGGARGDWGPGSSSEFPCKHGNTEIPFGETYQAPNGTLYKCFPHGFVVEIPNPSNENGQNGQ